MISAGDHGNDRRKFEPAAAGNKALQAAAAASRHWSASTEARIGRVSRVFGGKDRHSKVYTAKGIRDRRVRLSVATAVQFYALQDRLGYDQPSKAVEWLIKAAAAAIDKLPELDAAAFAVEWAYPRTRTTTYVRLLRSPFLCHHRCLLLITLLTPTYSFYLLAAARPSLFYM